MTAIPESHSKDILAGLKTDVERARQDGNQRQESLALARYGAALFQARKFQLGLKAFDKAVTLATELGDLQLQVDALSLKMAAYQSVERLPDAYETATVILRVAEAHKHTGLSCDAVLSQAQILINSGDPVTAFEPLKRAFDLASEMADDRRLMKVYGALGSHQLAVADLSKALAYFQSAQALADRIGDMAASLGFRVNVATVRVWGKQYEAAAALLDETLVMAATEGNQEIELTCLRYLIECERQLGDPVRLRSNAESGVILALELHDDAAVFAFYEALVMACFRLGREADARAALYGAVAHAGVIGDIARETELWLHLGEACMVAGLYDEARAAYEPALAGVRIQQRLKDEAYIVGRLGVTCAELGRTRESIVYHRQAAILAHERDLQELEGEQLSLLAMALAEAGQINEALACCRQASACFTANNLESKAQAAQKLLYQLGAPAPA